MHFRPALFSNIKRRSNKIWMFWYQLQTQEQWFLLAIQCFNLHPNTRLKSNLLITNFDDTNTSFTFFFQSNQLIFFCESYVIAANIRATLSAIWFIRKTVTIKKWFISSDSQLILTPIKSMKCKKNNAGYVNKVRLEMRAAVQARYSTALQQTPEHCVLMANQISPKKHTMTESIWTCPSFEWRQSGSIIERNISNLLHNSCWWTV